MREKYFLKELAEIMLSSIASSQNKHLAFQVWNIGRFNRRVFSPHKMFRQHASSYIRFLMNIAMGMTEKEFRDMMLELTNRIVDAANSDECDQINQNHNNQFFTRFHNF